MEDKHWVKAMQEELDHFQKNNIWKFVELPQGKNAVGAKWLFRNQLNEVGKVVKSKAKLVAKGYLQQEGIDYNQTYALVAHLKAICIPFFAHNNMKLYQMNVKNTFINGLMQKEVYVEQPPWFEGDTFSQHVLKLNKAFYELKQAHHAWYE